MAASVSKQHNNGASINVTPLVDIVLVLLVIFMFVTPVLQNNQNIDLPKAAAPDAVQDEAQSLILTYTESKKLSLDQVQIDQPEQLSNLLGRKIALSPGRRVILRADGRLKFSDIKLLMNAISQAGAGEISLAVDEEKKAAP